MFDLMPFDRRTTVSAYNPFRDLDNFEKAFFGRSPLSEFKTDIKDIGDAYTLEADLPGFKKEDINLALDGDLLTITAQRNEEHEERDDSTNYVRRERSYGCFTRSFDVSAIQTDAIAADYADGVLKLTLPKKSQATPTTRTIAIN